MRSAPVGFGLSERSRQPVSASVREGADRDFSTLVATNGRKAQIPTGAGKNRGLKGLEIEKPRVIRGLAVRRPGGRATGGNAAR